MIKVYLGCFCKKQLKLYLAIDILAISIQGAKKLKL